MNKKFPSCPRKTTDYLSHSSHSKVYNFGVQGKKGGDFYKGKEKISGDCSSIFNSMKARGDF